MKKLSLIFVLFFLMLSCEKEKDKGGIEGKDCDTLLLICSATTNPNDSEGNKRCYDDWFFCRDFNAI